MFKAKSLLFLPFIASLLLGPGQATKGQLKGTTGLLKGNCMPSYGAPPCKPEPVQTWVYISQPSEKFNKEKLIDSVRSDVNGQYEIDLAPDTYSLFVAHESEILCTRFNCTPECSCLPVLIKSDSVHRVDLVINKASW